ncbi:MAG: putative metal-binding motif-containing protein, partial [Candidatus Pacearchaeota archaeon]
SGGNSSKSEDSSEGDSGDNSDSRSENGLSSDGSEDDSSSEDGGGICVDKDQDNYINKSSSSAFICNSFAGYDGNDCNDSNLDVHEGHQEICGDNVDNDCDGQVDENCGQQAPASGGNFDLMKRESQTFFRSGSGINSKSDNITLENTGSQEIYISGSVRGPAAEYITISQKSQISEPGVSYFTYTVQRPDTIGGPITGTLVLSTRSTQKEVSLVIGAR